jgi:hypothetical protein
MKGIAVLLLGILVCPALASDTHGTVCVAPIPPGGPRAVDSPEHVCRSGKLSYRIDSRPAIGWPHRASFELEDIDITHRHRVIVFCDGKPQQSFSFSFDSYKSTDLCLFINDLYQTAQLWERKQSPWCKCK